MRKLLRVSSLPPQLLAGAAPTCMAIFMQNAIELGWHVGGDVGSSKGVKADTFTLQELQGRTNKALMVDPSPGGMTMQSDCRNCTTRNAQHLCHTHAQLVAAKGHDL